MLNVADKKYLSETFVTKREHKIDMREMKDEILDTMESFRTEVKNTIYQFKDDILTELRGMRDELVVIGGHRDRIDDLDIRVTKIEGQMGSSKTIH